MSLSVLQRRVNRLGLLGYPPAEVRFVYETMRDLKPTIVVEYGTNVGHSARLFHEARRVLGLTCPVHSVDVVDKTPALRPEDEGKLRGHHVQHVNVALHVGRGAETAVNLCAGAERPLLFCDDSHDQHLLASDLDLIAQELPGAVVLVHDYRVDWPDGNHGVKAFMAAHPGYRWDDAPDGARMTRFWPR